MSLPVSQYEALLAEVRGLRRKAHQVQQLAAPLLLSSSSASASLCPCPPPSLTSACKISKDETLSEDTFTSSYRMESLVFQRHRGSSEYDRVAGSSEEGETAGSEEEYGNVARSATQLSVSSEPLSNRNKGLSVLYHGTWPVERPMWNSDPTNLAPPPPPASHYNGSEMESVISFASSSGGAPLDRVLGSPDRSRRSSQQLEAKVDMVYSLLAMLGGQEHADMGETLLALSTSSESCLAMRQSGCIPLLVQLVQSDKNSTTRKKASQALHNLVYSNPDEKQKKRESRVLKLLEQTRAYISFLRNQTDFNPEDLTISEDGDKHPVQTMAHLMKLSFDEGHRQAICHLGGIHIIASLIEVEHSEHGNNITNSHCVLLRRYGCMALTNLTFGDSGNKALLCSLKSFMFSLVSQLENTNDELCQVTASVLRNLSWRADSTSKEILREIGAVVQLMKAAMTSSKENTLKSILSALWNLSAHCSENKAEICAVEGALGFLVDMLSYKSPTKSLAIIENAGGILRNISSQIAVRDDYREILRRHSCLQILLDLLKSPSLTIVSNSCGTLWNLSAKNVQDQETLLQMGAPAMLRSLNHSKHKMIAMGSSAALRNLIASKPSHSSLVAEQLDSTAKAMDLPALPSLGARKQKALMEELDQNLAETFENIDKDSPTKSNNNNHEEKFKFEQFNKKKFNVQKSKWDAGDGEGDGDGGDVARISGSEEYNVLLSEDAASAGSRGESRNCKSDTCLDDDDDDDHLTSNFAKLNIVVDHHQLVKMNKCAANLNKIKNEFSDDCCYDEIEQVERPIDYTRKYNTTESKIIPRTTTSSSSSSFVVNNNNNNSSSSAAAKNVTQQQLEDESFDGIYAETDLDQPTDYSLRYGEEDDSDPEDLCSQNKSHDFVSDTVKTYCTEDTPYETPFNFSTATSMSDLRDVDKQPVTTVHNNDKIKCEVDREKITGGNNNNNNNDNIIIIIDDEKDRCSVEDASEEADNKQEVDDSGSGGNKPSKSEFSSGILSPEKPVRYAEEGTPGYFSRVSSFGSLNSMPSKDGGMVIEKSTKDEIRTEHDLVKGLAKCSPQEGKVVKFDTGVNYAEETPLMFSRSSSLASLDSIDQHSIHEDRESVVSDFSRLASGVVSPSELPDSPTQTIAAPSPRRRKPSSNHDYPSTSSTCSKGMFNKLVGSKENQVVKPQPVQKSSVFEDNVTKFKEENTPVQFSTATSLSSLTFDEPDANNSNKNEKGTSVLTTNDTDTVMESAKEITEKQDVGQEKDEEEEEEEGEEGSSKNSDNLQNASESEEEDEDILAACINDGMQNNRHRQSKDNSISSRIPTSLIGYKNPLTSLRLPGSSVVVVHPVRSPTSTPVRVVADVHSDTLHNYCTEDTPAMLSYAGSHSNLSTLSTVNESPPKKDEKNDHLSDDSGSVLSADNDNNILAECIQSAMPKKPHRSKVETTAQKATTTTTSPSPFSRTRTRPESDGTTTTTITNRDNANRQNSTVCYLGAKDETERYAVENSPCHFSLRSSLSDLTIDGSVCGVTRRINNTTAEEIEEKTTKREEVNEEAGPSLLESENIIQLGLPRRDSLSSLSVESFGSTEQEQALLEQCISSGMPKNKPSQLSSNSKSSPKLPKRNYDVKEQQQQQDDFPSKPINCKEREREREDLLLWHDEYEESKEPRHFTKTSSKNVYVTSAAGIMVPKITVGEMCPDPRATVAGGENTATEQHDLERNHRKDLQEEQVVVVVVVEEEPGTRTQDNNTLLVQRDNNRRCSLSEEKCSSIEPTKNGSNEDESGYETTRFFVDEVEEVGNGSPVNDIDIKNVKIDNRMLDPDAMIESLDRFTAELVSQAEVHLSKDNNNKSTVSTTFDGDTWNDDYDDDDVSSFPSVSGSAPNVVTFKSDNESPPETTPLDILDGVVKNEEEEEGEEKKSNDFSSLESNTMTESTLIAFEATKMATIIQNQSIMMSESVASVHSLELDLIEPPSQMNSLTNSLNTDHVVVVVVTPKQSPKLTKRKKILQPGLLARRALGGGYHQTATTTTTSSSSLDNLSNLDSINPPSAMCDLLDMEGSTNSIPSLTSEIADFKLDFVTSGPVTYTLDKWQPPNPIFKLKQPTTTTTTIENDCDSWSGKLEHINPPSLFLNEITTDTNSCSLADVETLFEDAKNNTCVKTEEEDDDTITTTTTHYSDALNTSPMASDVAAAAAAASASTSTESTPKKSKTLHKRLTPKQKRNLTRERYRTYTVAAEMVVNEEQQQKIIKMSPSVSEAPLSRAKLSPKEKRQNDRDRFQTQLLDQSLVTSVLMKMQQKDETSQLSSAEPSTSSSPPPPPPPTSSRNRCDFVQRRLENRDRFKTRTLSESSSVSPDKSSSSPTHNEDLHSLIRREANLVVKSLNKAHTAAAAAAAAVFDDFLDCETLSLVSNDDDSEQNYSINYRTYTKHTRVTSPPLPSSHVPTAVTTIPQEEISQRSPTPENVSDSSESSERDDPAPKTTPSKPKIIKPSEKREEEPKEECNNEKVEPVKSVRGRRKPLYSPSKPIRGITSNLVRNVTSALKCSASNISIPQRERQTKKVINKPPLLLLPPPQYKKPTSSSSQPKTAPATPKRGCPTMMGGASPRAGSSGSGSANSSKVSSPVRTPTSGSIAKSISPKKNTSVVLKKTTSTISGVVKVGPIARETTSIPRTPPPPSLERQGTFTKDDKEDDNGGTSSKIPTTPPSSSSRAGTSRIARPISQANRTISKPQSPQVVPKGSAAPDVKVGPMKSMSADRSRRFGLPRNDHQIAFFTRSPSADGRVLMRQATVPVQGNSKSTTTTLPNRSITTSSITTTTTTTRSSTSNSSISSSNGASNSRKQQVSKIASLWKKVEEQKKNKPQKPDTRLWIQPNKP